jgi:hypothetical protein
MKFFWLLLFVPATVSAQEPTGFGKHALSLSFVPNLRYSDQVTANIPSGLNISYWHLYDFFQWHVEMIGGNYGIAISNAQVSINYVGFKPGIGFYERDVNSAHFVNLNMALVPTMQSLTVVIPDYYGIYRQTFDGTKTYFFGEVGAGYVRHVSGHWYFYIAGGARLAPLYKTPFKDQIKNADYLYRFIPGFGDRITLNFFASPGLYYSFY